MDIQPIIWETLTKTSFAQSAAEGTSWFIILYAMIGTSNVNYSTYKTPFVVIITSVAGLFGSYVMYAVITCCIAYGVGSDVSEYFQNESEVKCIKSMLKNTVN